MTDAELTAFIERVVDEKLRDRDRKMSGAIAAGLRDAVKEAKRQRRLHGHSA